MNEHKNQKPTSVGAAIGRPVQPKGRGNTWVQTERAGHEAWGRLAIKSPIASAVLHTLCARMGQQNAVVVSQKTLAAILGVSDRSIRTAVSLLAAERWLQIVRLNGPGTVAAYVVNSAIAWGERRDKLHTALFSATVVADAEDQLGLEHADLRQIPVLFPGERQLPAGPGEDPPSQPSIPGIEPDLPSLQSELERRSQQSLQEIDPETGEIR
jgi:DNA-binding transcriptional regulator YdaS (Cro superfamily)